MTKKFASLGVALCMALSLCVPGFAAASGGFQKTGVYQPGQFTDVSDGAWYAENVRTAYEYGLMTGQSDKLFGPDGSLTAAEAVTIACRLHDACSGGRAVFEAGTPWYQPYVDYAKENRIIGRDYDYSAPIDRLDFAQIISAALPDSVLPEINDVAQNDIPDLYAGSPAQDALAALTGAGIRGGGGLDTALLAAVICGDIGTVPASEGQQAVYRLYRAGILTGNDEYGTFAPETDITRSAVAAIVSRVAEPSLRRQVALAKKTTQLVPVDQLANLPSVRERADAAQFAQAYEEAKKIVEPLRGLSREAQLCGIAVALRVVTEENVAYSMDSAHYADPYGFFLEHSASCAGCTRATGLCLNMLGIPYEHVNENAYSHQWTRVNVNGTYWICDAYGLYCGPEQAPYQHPRFQ